MLLALRDYTKISTTERRMDGPQTRTEKKGRKKGEKGVYSAKHVRLTEALVAGASTSGSGSKGRVGVEPVRVPSNAGAPQRKLDRARSPCFVLQEV